LVLVVDFKLDSDLSYKITTRISKSQIFIFTLLDWLKVKQEIFFKPDGVAFIFLSRWQKSLRLAKGCQWETSSTRSKPVISVGRSVSDKSRFN